MLITGAYDALSMQEGVGIDIDADAVEAAGGAELIETFVEARSLTTLLLVRYAGGVPVAGIVAATMHYVAADSAPPSSRVGAAAWAPPPPLRRRHRRLHRRRAAAAVWALCTLMVHIFYGYSVLALELLRRSRSRC